MRGDKTTGKLNNRGFTLAEVLIVVAILVVLFGLGFAFKGIGLDAAYLLGPSGNAWTATLRVTL